MDPRTTESVTEVDLEEGVTAIVSADAGRKWVFLSIADDARGTILRLRIPSQQASDLAVALVNAANGV